MVQLLALVLFVTAVVVWWRQADRQKRQLAAPAAKRNARSGYHCVEVRAGVRACEAAQYLGNVRFLPGEAPALPVSGCTEQQCACRYIHHDDRREDDRRNPCGLWANLTPAEGERRSRAERRRSREGAFKPSIAR
jgi:hypothetical protein